MAEKCEIQVPKEHYNKGYDDLRRVISYSRRLMSIIGRWDVKIIRRKKLENF
jgi:hypothetical protein